LAPPENIELPDLLNRSISKPRPEKRNLQKTTCYPPAPYST
jgi:hypothetical protein